MNREMAAFYFCGRRQLLAATFSILQRWLKEKRFILRRGINIMR